MKNMFSKLEKLILKKNIGNRKTKQNHYQTRDLFKLGKSNLFFLPKEQEIKISSLKKSQ